MAERGGWGLGSEKEVVEREGGEGRKRQTKGKGRRRQEEKER